MFKEVPLANLFKQNYGDEGFYNGEEADIKDEEHSESTREEEEQTEEPCREESITSRTTPAVKVSTITPPVVLATLSNLSYQST
jgi:hypothetical protein